MVLKEFNKTYIGLFNEEWRMELKSFRVRDFRSINDNGKIDASRITRCLDDTKMGNLTFFVHCTVLIRRMASKHLVQSKIFHVTVNSRNAPNRRPSLIQLGN
jgi:hypothetical protein